MAYSIWWLYIAISIRLKIIYPIFANGKLSESAFSCPRNVWRTCELVILIIIRTSINSHDHHFTAPRASVTCVLVCAFFSSICLFSCVCAFFPSRLCFNKLKSHDKCTFSFFFFVFSFSLNSIYLSAVVNT